MSTYMVQFARIVLEYIKSQTKGWADKNKCYKIMLKVRIEVS